jgi:hypothetical protein
VIRSSGKADAVTRRAIDNSLIYKQMQMDAHEQHAAEEFNHRLFDPNDPNGQADPNGPIRPWPNLPEVELGDDGPLSEPMNPPARLQPDRPGSPTNDRSRQDRPRPDGSRGDAPAGAEPGRTDADSPEPIRLESMLEPAPAGPAQSPRRRADRRAS